MDTLKSASTAALQRLAAEAEQTLQGLRAELRRREECAQHAEIDHLEDYLASAELSLRTLKEFFNRVLAELRADEDPP